MLSLLWIFFFLRKNFITTTLSQPVKCLVETWRKVLRFVHEAVFSSGVLQQLRCELCGQAKLVEKLTVPLQQHSPTSTVSQQHPPFQYHSPPSANPPTPEAA